MADEDLSGAVLDGRYKVIAPIAEGAMGSVYRGERLKLGRAVAIKIMHDALPDELSSRQRFEREAKLMALLEHPHCVSVIDFGIHDDKPFLVMDLVRGTSLADLMEKTGRFEVARACDIVRQVLSGLGHAHELGIVHRDIKPANIMLSSKTGLGEQVRILDFGLARLTDTGTKLTTGIVVGTPNYMAPEQCRGSDVDGRSDLYACGVLLFELLTGRKPFVADDPIQVVRKHLQEPPPRLGDVEPGIAFGELEAVVAKALAKNPADRFESAEQMTAAIEAAVARRSVPATPAELFARAVPQTGSAPPPGQVATPSGWAVPEGMADTAPGGPDGPRTMTDAQASAYVPGSAPSSVAPAPIGHAPSAPVTAPHAQIPSAPIVAPVAHAPTAPAPVAPTPAVGMPVVASDPRYTPVAPTPIVPIPAQPAPGGMSDLSAILPSPDVEPSADPSLAIPVAPAAPPATDGTPGRTGTAIALGAVPAPHATAPSGPTGSAPPSAAPRASGMPSLPFTRRQLAIGGGGLLGLIILIAIVAGRGSSRHATSSTNPVATQPSNPAATDDQVQPLIDQANQLAASDDLEGAHELLRKALRQYPDNAKLAFTAGRICFWKLWWTEGIDHFRDAIRINPSYRSDPDLIKTVLRGFITTPDIDDRIESFLREDLGTAAVPYLEETAKDHPNAGIRARAKSELRRIH